MQDFIYILEVKVIRSIAAFARKRASCKKKMAVDEEAFAIVFV